LGSGISQIANKSCLQNNRVTPRATSAAMGGSSVKQGGKSESAAVLTASG
jgi:hypothetical protein